MAAEPDTKGVVTELGGGDSNLGRQQDSVVTQEMLPGGGRGVCTRSFQRAVRTGRKVEESKEKEKKQKR